MFKTGRIFTFVILFSFCLSADTSLLSKIPLNIWQTDKIKELPMPAIEAQQTWISLNPEFSCFLYDDADIENYIHQKWSPDFLDLFHALPIGAMKADLWRYLILATEGGVYSDIDSICIRPVREWPLNGSTPNHVLLIDLDCNQSQFCQWTFASTPGHPAMKYVCNYVLNKWKKKGIALYSDGTINVLATTGPAIFSSAIKKYIDEPQDVAAFKILKKYVKDKEYRKRLNRLGIFFTPKGYFSGVGAKNLFWGSWVKEAKKLAEERNGFQVQNL